MMPGHRSQETKAARSSQDIQEPILLLLYSLDQYHDCRARAPMRTPCSLAVNPSFPSLTCCIQRSLIPKSVLCNHVTHYKHSALRAIYSTTFSHNISQPSSQNVPPLQTLPHRLLVLHYLLQPHILHPHARHVCVKLFERHGGPPPRAPAGGLSGRRATNSRGRRR